MTTTNNAVVVYSGNGLPDKIVTDGKPMKTHYGITLEAQMMPDAIHHEGFGFVCCAPAQHTKPIPFIASIVFIINKRLSATRGCPKSL